MTECRYLQEEANCGVRDLVSQHVWHQHEMVVIDPDCPRPQHVAQV